MKNDFLSIDLLALRPAMELRARMIASIRRFFISSGFLEVETPLRIHTPALEEHIDAISAGAAWLRTSPELHMKRLLAAGFDRIFQIGPCFRLGEYGARHNPEFLMLEWYRVGADYMDILADTKALITAVIYDITPSHTWLNYGGRRIECAGDWHIRTVADTFAIHAGWDPTLRFDADRFDMDMINIIEPALPQTIPAVLMDYPAAAAALARCRPGNPPVAERWELYAGGMELANAFTELTDADEQRRRFEECAALRRAADKPVYPPDQDFLDAMERGLPPCAGVALGLDRLAMLLCDAKTLDEIMPFRCRFTA